MKVLGRNEGEQASYDASSGMRGTRFPDLGCGNEAVTGYAVIGKDDREQGVSPSVGMLFAARRLPRKTTVNSLMDELGSRGPAFLLAAASVPAIVPSPGIPAGMIFGTVLVCLALGLILPGRSPRLPSIIGDMSLPRKGTCRMLLRGAYVMRRLESLLRPRWKSLSGRAAEPWIGLAIILFGAVIALPIPLANTLPGIGVLLLGLGMMSRDGTAVLTGLSIGGLGVGFAAAVLVGSWAYLRTAVA